MHFYSHSERGGEDIEEWKNNFPKEGIIYRGKNGILYEADSLTLLDKFPEESVNLILTDPPYGAGFNKVKGDDSLRIYLLFLNKAYRVLASDSFMITYCFPAFIHHVIEHAEKAGFKYEWIGFNYYPNMFKQKPSPLGYNRHEPFLIFSKGNPKKSAYMKDVVHILMERGRKALHPHEKPLKAIEKLVKCASREGDIVLDPFLGSGTTAIACEKLGRRWIGIEIEKHFCELAIKRLKST